MAEIYNKISDEFVCPYCFKASKLKRIQFRSNNDKLADVVDNKKNQFWGNFSKYVISFNEKIDLTPRIRGMGLHTIRNKAGSSVPVLYYDEAKCATDIRLCPNCHNELPQNLGFVNSSNILIVGEDSRESFEYTKELFASYAKDANMTNVQFYVPDETFFHNLGQAAIRYDKYRFLVGKAVYVVENKVKCEFTVTYLPLGLEDIQSASADFENQIRMMFQNANGIIFVSDYNKVLQMTGDIDTENILEEYIFKLQNILKNCCVEDRAANVAVVLRHSEDTLGDNPQFNRAVSDYIYGKTEGLNWVRSENTVYYQRMRMVFSKTNFFFVANKKNTIKNSSVCYPLNWIIELCDFSENNS